MVGSKKSVSVFTSAEDPIWHRLQTEAREALDREPTLAALYALVLSESSFEEALVKRLCSRLFDASLPFDVLSSHLYEAIHGDISIGAAAKRDIEVVIERDPACERLLEPFLYFKGYASIQAHRFVHWFWRNGQRNLALYLQGRASEVFHTDIHPGAYFGRGILLDHATGFVAGETVIIEDDVSILHGVTLGGTGTHEGKRHPTVRTGVLIGAGAQIIGNVEIGAFSKIAAGSFVTQSVPPRYTAVGVPAHIIQGAGMENPAESMNQELAPETYEFFTYVI